MVGGGFLPRLYFRKEDLLRAIGYPVYYPMVVLTSAIKRYLKTPEIAIDLI